MARVKRFAYQPGEATAYESIRFLTIKVPFGWLIRSVHSWSAHLMIISSFFGAVYVNAPIEKFATLYRDVKKLKENKVYLDVQEFSPGGAPPKISDFERLSLDRKDIDELKTCKPGECDLQIFDDIDALQKKIDWNSAKLEVTGMPEAAKYIKRAAYRPGWDYSSAKV